MGGANRSEGGGQLTLHGVARGLCRRGNQRKDGPKHCVASVPGVQAAAERISAASGNSDTVPFSLSISRNKSK